ncbi:tRNA-dihydrouridine synthase [Citroniella saccharovorans]|uniref:tRNA-dihydrouridine synthase n=2 Tax=Citroniella saccharovorans TaxID=2053367 RepID=A0AAW9MWI6_9FIRM|nr:tRNA-dihydrouridine synthase [Citroniella saccharovorans]
MYKFIMAPLAGITDRAFREIVKEYGADLTFTEMVNVKGLYYKDEKTFRLVDIGEDEKNVGIQIFGRDIEIIKKVTYDYLNTLAVDVIDFNFGCPAPKIFKNNEGSALLKEPKLMGDIIKAIKENTDKMVSSKIRIGIDRDLLNYMEVLESLEDAAPDFITVHARTRKGYYHEDVNYEAIKKMVEKSTIPIVANGGIFDIETLKKQEETGAKSFMVARGALGNPLIFRSLKEGKNLRLSFDERMDLIFKHYRKMIEYKGERLALFEMRKHIAWYLKGLKSSNKIKNEINNEKSIERVFELLDKYRNNQEN